MSYDIVTITLVSNDGEEFEVPINEARLSGFVHDSISEDDDQVDGEIVDIMNVSADILRKVLEFCSHYVKEKMNPIETPLKSTRVRDLVQDWYANFCDSMDDQTLFRLVTAADYMNIQPIIDLACLKVAVLMKGKSGEEIKKIFAVSRSMRDAGDTTR